MSRHFERSLRAEGATSIHFSPPTTEEARLVGCYELIELDVVGLASVCWPKLSGRILYTDEGLQAATVKLPLAEAPNSSVLYSGYYRTMGGDVSTHILHWARCNLHAGQVDPVVDSTAGPANYFATRVRAMELSDDAQTLTLTPAEGVRLRWRRAPERGWHHADGPSVQAAELMDIQPEEAMGAAAGAGAQTVGLNTLLIAQRVYKASMVMTGLAANFIEPARFGELGNDTRDDEEGDENDGVGRRSG